MPVMSSLCVYADVDNSLLSETKTFNNMSPTEGFDYPYPQYMSAIFLLRTCYDLLIQAGFKNVEKDEGEQSLTIWGLKLFFVNIAGNKNTVNIAGPGINFLYKRNKQKYSDDNEAPSSSYGTPVERYNHFLQYSVINSCNVYSREGAQYNANSTIDYSGWECANDFYKNVDDDGNTEYMLYITLRCSNDGICFSTQVYNERQDLKGYQFPLFNIFKGKDVLNDKDVLILGKKIERVPFVFSTPYANAKTAITSVDTRMTKTTAYNSNQTFSGLQYGTYTNNDNTGMFNMSNPYALNLLNHSKDNHTTHCNYITASLDSALVCSGNNLLYYTDDTYTQLEDTLYLDWAFNIDPTMIRKGNAIANSGKYIVYGINQILDTIPVQSNYYYDIEDEKYWCMFNHLITRYISLYNNTDNATLKSYMDTNYFNQLATHQGAVAFFVNSGSTDKSYVDLGLTPTYDFLNMYANSFGKMKKNIYEDSTVLNSDKKAWAVCLNPAILMRIDDVITE